MALTKEETASLIKKYGKNEKDQEERSGCFRSQKLIHPRRQTSWLTQLSPG